MPSLTLALTLALTLNLEVLHAIEAVDGEPGLGRVIARRAWLGIGLGSGLGSGLGLGLGLG